MTDPWPLRSSLELGALPTAASCACTSSMSCGSGADLPSRAGKVVWCEMDTASPAPAADLAPPLPRRIPRAGPKPKAEIVTDLDLLRRLRDHLRS
jgi:hypothetical protein